MKYLTVDGIICNRKDYDDNYEVIRTINTKCGVKKKLHIIFFR
ncbi:MAG: hypothetical protein WC260_01550 [Candidatus Pacearchaeota archaeon]